MIEWPISTIDYEASGLGPTSYPIEVGIAVWRTFDAPIEVWSTLIAPAPAWLTDGEWNAKSAAIHSIPFAQLADGISAADCAHEVVRIAQLFGNPYADGGMHDDRWHDRLLAAGSRTSPCRLRSWQRMLRNEAYEIVDAMQTQLERSRQPHRAGEDAARLLHALATAYGAAPTVLPIALRSSWGIADVRTNPPSAPTVR